MLYQELSEKETASITGGRFFFLK
ncbi:bacteriocin [Chitinophaga arvensicola]